MMSSFNQEKLTLSFDYFVSKENYEKIKSAYDDNNSQDE